MKNREEVLQERIERKNSRYEIGNNISWSAIFAGAVTFVAIMFLLSFIGSSIGFATLDFQSSNPFSGLFTGVGIWTVVQLLISLFAAGFVGGLAAKRVGLLHGFLSWALSMALVVTMLFTAVTATVRTAANTAGAVAGVATDAASTVAESVSSLSSTAFEKISEEVEGVDSEELKANVEKYLVDSENEKLRPGYLQSQVDVSVEEIKQAAKDIALDPENAETIVKDTADKIGARAEDIANSVSQEDIKKAVSKNSELTEAEVEEISNNIYDGLQKTYAQAEETFKQASVEVSKTVEQAKAILEDAKETGNEVASTSSKASLLVFVGLLLSALAAMYGGSLGSKVSNKRFIEEN